MSNSGEAELSVPDVGTASSDRGVGKTRGVGEHFEGDLRRALLDAAVVLLNEAGADGLSLRAVARSIGVSHAAPAHHFGDKTGLLTALAIEGFEQFIDHLASTLAVSSARPPIDQLSALGVAYAQFAERHPGQFDVMFRPGLTNADDPAYRATSDAAFESLHGQIMEYQRSGWRPNADSRSLAAGAWALAHGVAVLRLQGSLARHARSAEPDGVVAIVEALLGC